MNHLIELLWLSVNMPQYNITYFYQRFKNNHQMAAQHRNGSCSIWLISNCKNKKRMHGNISQSDCRGECVVKIISR
jgi:hypothetical protein